MIVFISASVKIIIYVIQNMSPIHFCLTNEPVTIPLWHLGRTSASLCYVDLPRIQILFSKLIWWKIPISPVNFQFQTSSYPPTSSQRSVFSRRLSFLSIFGPWWLIRLFTKDKNADDESLQITSLSSERQLCESSTAFTCVHRKLFPFLRARRISMTSPFWKIPNTFFIALYL